MIFYCNSIFDDSFCQFVCSWNHARSKQYINEILHFFVTLKSNILMLKSPANTKFSFVLLLVIRTFFRYVMHVLKSPFGGLYTAFKMTFFCITVTQFNKKRFTCFKTKSKMTSLFTTILPLKYR